MEIKMGNDRHHTELVVWWVLVGLLSRSIWWGGSLHYNEIVPPRLCNVIKKKKRGQRPACTLEPHQPRWVSRLDRDFNRWRHSSVVIRFEHDFNLLGINYIRMRLSETFKLRNRNTRNIQYSKKQYLSFELLHFQPVPALEFAPRGLFERSQNRVVPNQNEGTSRWSIKLSQ